MEIYKSKDGTEVAVLAATWELNPKVTFTSLSPEFRANPVKAWRNYGSRLTLGNAGTAIRDPQEVLNHLNTRRLDPWDLTRQKFRVDLRGRRGIRYFMHLDLAKSGDAAGIACVHRESTGVVVVDFMHAHRARPNENIQFRELREKYIYGLHALGFHLQMVTFDQWQSEEMRQILQEQGFETDLVSADKTTGPYDTLIEMMLTDRLDYYNHPVFIKEMQQLRTNGVKYDHPKKGSKDLADAVACATWKAINYELENPVEAPGVIRVYRPNSSRSKRANPVYERSVW